MHRRFLLLVTAALSVSVLSLVVLAQADPWVGTWKLNVAKSRWSSGPPTKSQVAKIERIENGFRSTVDAVDGAGRSTHTVISARFDGKEYVLEGNDPPTMRIYRRIDDRTYEYVNKVNGKVTTTNRVTVSADGKTRTVTTTGNPDGKPVNNVLVFDREGG
jgi:hypothetical protein